MDHSEIMDKIGLTDRQLDDLADQYESGDWPEGTTVVLGRPRISDEELASVTFRIPRSDLELLDIKARTKGKTRSAFIRDLIRSAAM